MYRDIVANEIGYEKNGRKILLNINSINGKLGFTPSRK